MRDRKIQRMVKRGEITQAEGAEMAALKAAKSASMREESIPYRNSEQYADPTAFYAVQNIVREEKKARRINRANEYGTQAIHRA